MFAISSAQEQDRHLEEDLLEMQLALGKFWRPDLKGRLTPEQYEAYQECSRAFYDLFRAITKNRTK